jgi:hypothetical protein
MFSDTAILDMSGSARRERKREYYAKQAALQEHQILAKLRSEQWCVKVDKHGNWEAHKGAI